jgi:cellulose synthase/poly-beta-1,6-N-acetylglucosamine synthase-like glycosyltransferase
MALIAIAAVSFSLLALAWVAYPVAMRLRARGRVGSHASALPVERVSVVVATRDDPAFAVERVRNLRATDYPSNLIRVFVGVDVTSQFSLDSYRSVLAGLADVVPGDAPGGKATTLNAVVRAAAPEADVLVFADVGQEFGPGAIPELVSALRGGSKGAVTGRYTHGRSDGLMSAYADLEATIRAGQAAGRSVVSASGSILALRPAFWRDLPAGLICDDLYTGLSVVRQGSRVGFCPEAIAYDPRVFTRDQQFARRVRTLTGLIQYCVVEPGALLPWRNPVWTHFFIHKVLRLLTPILFVIGVAALGLWLSLRVPLVVLDTLGILALIAIAFRLISPVRFRRVRDQAVWSLRLMLVPLVAISNGLRGRWSVWTPTSQVRTDLGQRGA